MTTRRRFLQGSSALLAAPGAWSQVAGANDRLRVAVMGLGRGLDHVNAWLAIPNVEVAGLCEVDSRRLAAAAAAVTQAGQPVPPRLETDVRRLLDDKNIDVLSIAAPNFWHAPATLLACAAGKHVYVEKPGSHTGQEGEWMVAAARRHHRLVQQGTQRRSLPAIREAVQRLREGAIGPVRSARCWYSASRSAVHLKAGAPVPDWLDWDLWQGPSLPQPYLDNLAPYNWHWRWHYGGGELANNGVHMLDLALWGLEACWTEKLGAPLTPLTTTSTGGRYHFQDDQESPDTQITAFDFGPCTAIFDSSSCAPRRDAENHPLVTFYGDAGTLSLSSSGYQLFDLAGQKTAENQPPFDDRPHFQNLADAIRLGSPLHCDIATGQRSTRLCHLGNIAYRTRSTIHCHPATGSFADHPAARQFWSKDYRDGWRPPV